MKLIILTISVFLLGCDYNCSQSELKCFWRLDYNKCKTDCAELNDKIAEGKGVF